MRIKNATLNGYTTKELREANIAVTTYGGTTVVGRFVGSLEHLLKEDYRSQALVMSVAWSNDPVSILLEDITSIEILD